MIDSYTATFVLVVFILVFGLVIPILDKVPYVKDFISFRWSLVVIYSAMCLGVIIDFEHLDTSVRFAVVVGGIILSAIFLIVRSLEKAAVNKWKFPRFRGKVQRGNTSGEISVNPKLENSRLGDREKLCGSPVWLDTSLCALRNAASADVGALCAEILRRHDPSRVLFATDTPWSDPVSEIQFVQNLNLPHETQEGIFAGNAEALLVSCGWKS